MQNKINKNKTKKWLELTRDENFINGDLDILELIISHADKNKYKNKGVKKPLTLN